MAKKSAKKTSKKETKTDKESQKPQVVPAPALFVKAPQKTEEAKKREAQKGKEPWRHKATTGKAHPDNKPPVLIVSESSDEEVKKYEDAINAEREKQQPHTDWRDLEGGVPAEQPQEVAPIRYGPADADPRVKAEVKEEIQEENKSDKKSDKK